MLNWDFFDILCPLVSTLNGFIDTVGTVWHYPPTVDVYGTLEQVILAVVHTEWVSVRDSNMSPGYYLSERFSLLYSTLR